MRHALFLLMMGMSLRAGTLDELKQTLAAAGAPEPIAAEVSFEISQLSGETVTGDVQTGTLLAKDGPHGLELRWPRERVEHAMGKPDAARREPKRQALDGLRPTEIYEYLNIAGSLLEALGYAELTEERPDTWQGRAVKRLTLKLTPPLSSKDRKYIKDLTATAVMWLDDDGWPVAAERVVNVKGRAMLVITFEQAEQESFEFARAPGRLVVTRHEKSTRSSGAGEKGGRTTRTTLKLSST